MQRRDKPAKQFVLPLSASSGEGSDPGDGDCPPVLVILSTSTNQSIWTRLYETFRGVSRAEFGLK